MAILKIEFNLFGIRNFLMFLLFSQFVVSAFAQEKNLAKIKVFSGAYDRENTLVQLRLDQLNADIANQELALFEIRKKEEIPVESQVDMNDGPKLFWILNQKLPKGEAREYVLKLIPAKTRLANSAIQVINTNGNLIIKSEGKNVLQYNFHPTPLPKGVSDIYDRAGYIHPLWSPAGEVLTRIQPPDHYHHVGIWNPWTQTEFKGKVIDYWNLNKAEGTIRPAIITSMTANDLYGGFKAIHEHVDLNGATKKGYEISLREEWNVRAWKLEKNAWVIDFISTMNCATDSIFKILEYRYQGFGFRATEKWDDKTASILTSEGKSKADGNGTRARWCNVNGVSDAGTSGVLFITHPANFNYPEPIRIWPEGTNNGVENVFFNFNPAMDRDWVLRPGTDYQLKYRMYVYDGKIDAAYAEKLWRDFAYPPQVSINLIQK
jgi:hypothetical protein